MRFTQPLPTEEKIYHVAHHIHAHGLGLTPQTWALYGLTQRPALQRAVAVAVRRLRALGGAP